MEIQRLFHALLILLLLASAISANALAVVTPQRDFVLVKATMYLASGKVWNWIEYLYDRQGHCIGAAEYAGDGSYRGGWDSVYDSSGNLLSRTSLYEEDTMDYWYRYEYQYDMEGSLLKEVMPNEDGSRGNWVEYEYNAQGHLIQDTAYYGRDGTIAYITEYLNDRDGNPLVVVEKSLSRADSWIKPRQSWYEYEYDAQGNPTKIAFNPGRGITIWEEYDYDANGNRANALYYVEGELLHWVEYEYALLRVSNPSPKKPTKVVALFDDGKRPSYIESYPLDYYLTNGVSTRYSPELAKLAMVFSTAVYDRSLVEASLSNHGFTRYTTRNYGVTFNYSKPAFAMGEKTTKEGNKVIAIIVRGSRSLSDWLTDAGIGTGDEHQAFSNARHAMVEELFAFYPDARHDKDTIYFITGHSYGGATANLLAQSIGEEFGIDQGNIYAYTFATPNVTKVGMSLRNPDGEYDHIFNLCNRKDGVTILPTAVVSQSFTWGKYGRSYWFTLDHPMGDSAHGALLYLDFLLQLKAPDVTGNLGGYFTETTRSRFIVDGQLHLPDPNAPRVYRLTSSEETKATISGKVRRTGENFPTWCIELLEPLYALDYVSGEVIVCDKIYLYDSTDQIHGFPIEKWDQSWVTLDGQLEHYRGGGSIFLLVSAN